MSLALCDSQVLSQYNNMFPDNVFVYPDDTGIFSKSWEEHLLSIEEVLSCFKANGFMVNPLKCEWAIQETDWLGYWLTPIGLKPQKKWISAILEQQPPLNLKEMCGFLGAINIYWLMWPKWAHLLKPSLSNLAKIFSLDTGNGSGFYIMKTNLAADVLMTYPNHNLLFHLYTNASDYQMGAIIILQKWPVAYWTRKLTQTQKNYYIIEKELLFIVVVWKSFVPCLFVLISSFILITKT